MLLITRPDRSRFLSRSVRTLKFLRPTMKETKALKKLGKAASQPVRLLFKACTSAQVVLSLCLRQYSADILHFFSSPPATKCCALAASPSLCVPLLHYTCFKIKHLQTTASSMRVPPPISSICQCNQPRCLFPLQNYVLLCSSPPPYTAPSSQTG